MPECAHAPLIGRVVTVLTGQAVASRRAGHMTALAKQPCLGPVSVGPLGLAGDEQGDRVNHGGIDKAVHAYAQEHYPAWRKELGELDLLAQAGAFGENLATQGLDEWTVCLGDQWQVGSSGLVLEVSQGRQPCWKLNDRFGVPDMARRLQDTLRTGWYLRVLQAGSVSAGDDIRLLARPWPAWSIARIMQVLYERCLDAEVLQAMLALPLVPKLHTLVQNRLQHASVESWQARLQGPEAAPEQP